MGSGERLIGGRFRTLRRLGAGGMGSVVLAEDDVLGRLVAIKQLHPDSGPELAQRFRREMTIAASMGHPNVVRLLDAVVEDDDVFLVMEFVDGPTLSERLRQGPIPTDEALALLESLGEALDAIHAEGVVHRDVKPANILLGAGGVVKLADLGIARATDRSGMTSTTATLGTPAYLAPELFARATPTPAADIWSLAAVAYEVLSGNRARGGETPVAVAMAAQRDVAVDLSERWGDAPALEAALRRGLATDPADRQRSARGLVAEIADGVREAGQARAAETATALPREGPARAPRRGLAVLAPLVLVALVGAVVAIVALGGGSSKDAPRRAVTAARTQTATTTKTQSSTGASTSASTSTSAPQHAASAPSSPAAAVRAFYTRAAAHRFQAAWALAAPSLQAQLGGYDAFANLFGDVRSIRFGSLSADGPSVSFTTTATHASYVDHCSGTAATTQDTSGRPLVSHLAVNCNRSAT